MPPERPSSKPINHPGELEPGPIHGFIVNLSRTKKRMVMVIADLIALPLALYTAFVLRLETWAPPSLPSLAWLFVVMPLLGVFIFARLGLYRAVVRFIGPKALLAVVYGVLALSLAMAALAFGAQLQGFPRSVPMLFAMLALVYVGGSRLLVRFYYQWLARYYANKEPVLIYGAGGGGVQLAMALANGKEFYTLGFVDDDTNLWHGHIHGIRVYPPQALRSVIERYGVRRLLLALPSASKAERKRVLDKLDALPVHVQSMPSMPEIVSGEASVDQLREVEIEDLLGRDPVPPRPELLNVSIANKVVMVTGAGGSIGSELCRQILKAKPSKLILFELNEYSLYAIDQELQAVNLREKLQVQIYPFLGNVVNRQRVEGIVGHYGVHTLYHAAAYKHVPMVEHNVFEGIRNNVLGTQVVAEACARLKVQRCILVSTDKAVRPTNVMGASKRMAELVLQDLATQGHSTVFSMVRFGNVLGSSGSVVPLFRKQIAAGGPVTVTHPDITRFFMTIPEAALLVIQAGSMAEGGDVFVLDMGEPVKIVDLAKRMIQLSGLEVRSKEHPEGDIEIAYSGLRPGEKLYEELLIGDNVVGSSHPKIMTAMEEVLPTEVLARHIQALEHLDRVQDVAGARAVLREAVSGFNPSSPISDWLYVQPEPMPKDVH